MVITFIDLDHQIIPDVITLPGIPIFFSGSGLRHEIFASWMPFSGFSSEADVSMDCYYL